MRILIYSFLLSLSFTSFAQKTSIPFKNSIIINPEDSKEQIIEKAAHVIPTPNQLEALKKDNKQDGVIIISAKDAVEDKITGLKLGADDYLPKPFHLSELGARIYSVIRRKKFGSSNTLRINELEIDIPARRITVNNLPVQLTRREFDLLLFLIGNKNRVISKAALAEHLSGDMADMLDNHDFVYAHIKNLKKKLADAGCADYIKTAYGMGYKWET
jgi:DNA-binding response OmpR family regulator